MGGHNIKEYNVQVKVRNNYLLQVMRLKGIETAAQLSRESGVQQTVIGAYLNLTTTPMNRNGDLKPSASKLCEALQCGIDAIFPEHHLHTALETNKAEREVSADEIQGLLLSQDTPHSLLEHDELVGIIDETLRQLTPRQQQVISLRYGIHGEPLTLRQVGQELGGLSPERIRQIEKHALRRMRSPSIALPIQQYEQIGKELPCDPTN